MTSPLQESIARKLESLDVRADPLKVAEGARLLADVQEHELLTSTLEARVAAYVDATREPVSHRSLADWAYGVLAAAGTEMHYSKIAGAIRAEGFKHAREPKNPEKQLKDSVWTAMYEDPRFVKVGRGIFDLRERR